jgi:hypothetical protein
MKQETLEEGITKYLRTLNGDEYKSIYDFCNQQTLAFINGAKWQQERSYSEEDMMDYSNYRLLIKKALNPKEWFEQFKNK